MHRRLLSAFYVIALATLSGCASTVEKDDGRATITDAVYVSGEMETIRVTGDYFKIKSDSKSDVVVSLNGRNWKPATKIIESSPTLYVAEIPYGPAFPEVWVRVFGFNEEYSDVHLVHVRRK